jgi:hypothetical protein
VEARYIQIIRILEGFGTLRYLDSSQKTNFLFFVFSLGNLDYLTCNFDLKMCPLTLKHILKAARCLGDHVGI